MSQDRSRELERAMPHDAESERIVVGSIFMDNGLIAEATNIVSAEDFYVPAYRYIYEAQVNLFANSKEISPVLVSQELAKSGKIQNVGDVNYITSLMDMLPVILTLESYAKVIKDKSMLRHLFKASNKISQSILEEEDEAQVILEAANKSIYEVTMLQHTNKSFSKLVDLVHQSIQKTHEIQMSGKALTGIDTGFADLNSLTLGWQKSDLIIVAGRPSSGKTSFGMNLAQNASIRAGVCVGVFSLEMPEEQLAQRAACSEARVDSKKYRAGYVNVEEWGRVYAAEQSIAGAEFYIDDTPGITTLQIRAKSMMLATELANQGKELGLLIVDYLQLMSESAKRFESRQQEISQISRELKKIARELNLPLIALSQLNRAPENRTNHRPMLSDLRESGAIEQDADIVAFVYRGDMYKGPGEAKDNIAEIIVAKHRNGPTDTVNLRFDEPSTRFDDLYTNQEG